MVRLGEHDYSNDTDGAPHEDFGISRIVFHPEYSVKDAYHDIALVQLDVPVQLKVIRAGHLAVVNSQYPKHSVRVKMSTNYANVAQ